MDLRTIQDRLAAATNDRDAGRLNSPKHLAQAIAGDAGALLALLKWLNEEHSRQFGYTELRNAATDALTGIVLDAIQLADKLGIDLEDAIQRQLPKPLEQPVAETPKAREPSPPPREKKAAPERAKPAPRAERRAEPEVEHRAPPVTEDEPRPKVEQPSPPPPPPKVERPIPPAAPPSPPAPKDEKPRPPAPPAPAPKVEKPSPTPKPEAPFDSEEVLGLVRSLARLLATVGGDDPVVRELRDEVESLRRTLYTSTAKRAWIAGGLKTVQTMLEEAASHSVAEEILAEEHIAEIARILKE